MNQMEDELRLTINQLQQAHEMLEAAEERDADLQSRLATAERELLLARAQLQQRLDHQHQQEQREQHNEKQQKHQASLHTAAEVTAGNASALSPSSEDTPDPAQSPRSPVTPDAHTIATLPPSHQPVRMRVALQPSPSARDYARAAVRSTLRQNLNRSPGKSSSSTHSNSDKFICHLIADNHSGLQTPTPQSTAKAHGPLHTVDAATPVPRDEHVPSISISYSGSSLLHGGTFHDHPARSGPQLVSLVSYEGSYLLASGDTAVLGPWSETATWFLQGTSLSGCCHVRDQRGRYLCVDAKGRVWLRSTKPAAVWKLARAGQNRFCLSDAQSGRELTSLPPPFLMAREPSLASVRLRVCPAELRGELWKRGSRNRWKWMKRHFRLTSEALLYWRSEEDFNQSNSHFSTAFDAGYSLDRLRAAADPEAPCKMTIQIKASEGRGPHSGRRGNRTWQLRASSRAERDRLVAFIAQYSS